MKYDAKRPCNNCPFLRENGVRLRPERAQEIARCALDSQGASFTCHKTTVAGRGGDRKDGPNAQHCTGALILMEKNDTANQMARIAMRLGVYDPRKLDKTAFDLVFDDEDEMVEAHRTEYDGVPAKQKYEIHPKPTRRTSP